MNPKSQSGESAWGESHLADELYKVISKAQLLYSKQLLAKGVQRGKKTTDSIKIFSNYILYFSYCLLHLTAITKDTFRIVLYVTTFYIQHCAVARFVLKQ